MKKIYLLMLAGLFTLALGSCSEDELDKESIFPTVPVARDSFDKWLLKTILGHTMWSSTTS